MGLSKMFKAGDKVRKKDGETFTNDEEVLTVDFIEETTMWGTMVWLKETGTWLRPEVIEYAEEDLGEPEIGDTVEFKDPYLYRGFIKRHGNKPLVVTSFSDDGRFLNVNGGKSGNYTSSYKVVSKGTPKQQQTEGKQMQKVIFTYSQDSATVVVDGQVNVVTSGEASFEALVEELKKEIHDIELIKTLVNKKAAVQAFAKGNVEIKGSTVYFQGEVVSDSLTDKMLQLMDEGFDISPWVAFYENLQQNPSFRSRKCLFNFLEKFQAPFTEDGCFVAFKRVDQNFKDLRTHTMDNSVGAVVKMDRSQVDDDPGNTCSSGLHVAASSYLNSYASASRAKTIMLKVNPRDVVAVPHDYNFAKMRVCEYEVIADITVEQMKDLEKRGVIANDWEDDSGEDSYDWEIGDLIRATESDLDITEGEAYEIVEVDTSDNTVCVLDDVGDRSWLAFDGSVA